MKPTVNARWVSDYAPKRLNYHELLIIVDDMGKGKSTWVNNVLKHEKGGTLLSTRKSQTANIKRDSTNEDGESFKVYFDIEGEIDVSQ